MDNSAEVEPTTLVINTIADPLATGPIVLPELAVVVEVAPVVLAEEPALEVALAPTTVRRSRVISVRVPVTHTAPLPVVLGPVPLSELQAEVLEEVPTAANTWERFFFGLLLVLQVLAPITLLVSAHPAPGAVSALSAVLSLVGILVMRAAIRDEDHRVSALRAVGLR